MTTLNKLNRALDSLKKIVSKPQEVNKQKEKVALCLTITELVCKSNEKSSLLTFTVTSLIQLLEDADSNTRLVIDESLNKIIRVSIDNSNYVAKILIALLKVLGKNTNERCLRAALWRFAELAHFVRPQKGKIYVQTLVPIIVKIAGKKEETIIETLADSMPKIFKHVGLFSTDSDIKVLLKAFLKNVYSDSVEIRRAASLSITAICRYSRKPDYFFAHVLNTILDLLCDNQKTEQEDRNFIQGCLICIRQILPHVTEDFHRAEESGLLSIENLLQVYELCLQYAKFHDHNVITAALETLNQLLKQATMPLARKLTTKGSLTKSTLKKFVDRGSTLSLAAQSDIFSISSTIAQTEDGIFTDIVSGKRLTLFSSGSDSYPDLNVEQKQSRTEKWIQDQPEKEADTISSSLLNINVSHFANSDDEENTDQIDSYMSSSFRALSVDNLQQMKDHESVHISGRTKDMYKSEKSISVISEAISLNTSSTDLDIGDVFGEDNVPLEFCARFLVSAFLLEKQSSKKVRISVVSLTLNCLAQVLRLHPTAAFIPIEKAGSSYEGYANLLEVMLSYKTHDDQQVRGYARVTISHLIASVLLEENYLLKNYPERMSENLLQDLITVLLQGIEDESSVTIKLSLQALSVCLQPLLLCSKFTIAIPLIDTIFTLVDNPYWLIKVKVLEIIGDLSMELLCYVTENSITYQDRIFKKIIMVLLGDIDDRVRNAAANCLVKFTQNAYYPIDYKYELSCVTYVKKLNAELVIPYEKNTSIDTGKMDNSLARMVHHLSQIISETSSKYLLAGCSKSLSLLAQEYRPIKYPWSWQCLYYEAFANDNTISPCELFETVLSMMTNSTLVLNFDVHLQLLKLCSELFVGLSSTNLKLKKSNDLISSEYIWSFFSDNKLSTLSETFLQHLTRLACVFNDVVTNVIVKSPIPLHSPTYFSWPLFVDQLIPKQDSLLNDLKYVTENKKSFIFKMEEKQASFTQYNRTPVYMKLKEALKAAYNNYKVTLKPESSEKFILFLKTVIECLGMILDFTTLTEVDRISKDILSYLRNFMVFLPVQCVRCVVQLLKSVFGTNKIGEYFNFTEYQQSDLSENVTKDGLYECCFQLPYDKIVRFVNYNSKTLTSADLLKEWESRYARFESFLAKQLNKNASGNVLPSYIKLFEPSVIQSLKQYTVTSDTELQAEVLVLLSELVQLKINYCLLDSEQVFIKFVLSQFQLIEEGQLLNLEKLLPEMFSFLIFLANEKHSKPVMSVPKVIQLCDSLIASDQPVSHCVLAIRPITEHVFLKSAMVANTTEIKELETQRDVLFAMLLKLLNDPRSLQMITLVLNSSEEEIKLRRSCQIVELLFSTVIDCKIVVNNEDTFRDILDLFFALHQSSYNEQNVLNVMFSVYRNNQDRDPDIWLPFVCASLLLAVTRYDEGTILNAVEQMLNHPVFLDVTENVDPLFVNTSKSAHINPEKAFAKFVCECIYSVFNFIQNTKLLDVNSNCGVTWRSRLLSELLLIVSYVAMSGKYDTVKKELVQVEYSHQDEKKYIFEIADLCNTLLVTNPIIPLRWYDLLLDLKGDSVDLSWYFLQSNVDFDIFGPLNGLLYKKEDERNCISIATVKLGVFLLTCNHKDEITTNIDIFKFFLEHNFQEYLNTVHESPVHGFQLSIQSSPAISQMLIQIVQNTFPVLSNDNNEILRIFHCLELIHVTSKGEILLLCCQPQLLRRLCVPVSNKAISLAVNAVEHLLALNDNENHEDYLSKDDMETVIELVKQSKYQPPELVTLLNKLSTSWYQIQILSPSENKPLNYERIRLLSLDKMWYFNQVKYKCCNEEEPPNYNMALLLSELPLQDIFSIMRSQNFNNKILHHCFSIGTELTIQKQKKIDSEPVSEFSDLYLASRSAIFRHIEHLKSLLPRTHHVYMPVKREASKKELQYSQRMDIVFSDKEFTDLVLCLIPAVNEYLLSIEKLRSKTCLQLIISNEFFTLLADFAVLCLELLHWFIKNYRKWSKTSVLDVLKCCVSILKIKNILNLMSSSQMGSVICAAYALTENYTNELIRVSTFSIFQEVENTDPANMLFSSHLASTLIDYFIIKIPVMHSKQADPLFQLISQLLVTLSQSSSLYNYVRIPLEVWRHVSATEVTVSGCLSLNSLPTNFLQDKDILQNFISRLMLIGWNNRLQFEECWMSLLIALNSLPEYESTEEEVLSFSQINAMAVNAITSILVQTMYHPIPGNKILPTVFHVSRYKSVEVSQSRWKEKLEFVNNLLLTRVGSDNEKLFYLFNNNDVNLERLFNKNAYSFNQISVEYLTMCSTNIFASDEDVPSSYHFSKLRSSYQNRISILKNIGIDTNSCIYFLMDFYSRWFLKPDEQSVEVLAEILNSMLVISDIFTEISQFSWLLESGILLWKKYFRESDVICSYLTLIICKSAAVTTLTDAETGKLVVKVLKSGLSSSHVSVQVASLNGLIYLLESIFKKDTLQKNDMVSGEYEDRILSAAILFVLEHLDIDLSEKFTKEISALVVSVAFYLIENKVCGDNVDLMVDRLCKLSIRVYKLKKWELHVEIMQGFYNLVLRENRSIKNHDMLIELIKEIISISECTTFVSVLSLQVLIAIMYASGDFEDTRTADTDDIQFDPEKLILRIEKISLFFDRIKKSCKEEGRIICAVLPQILNDFSPPSEILNKVILEFLYPHHPHIELMAEIVFKVFQNAIQQSQLSLIQDMVLQLLNNFAKISLPKTVFCLNCFFISASTNPWLTAFFASVSQRNGLLEYEDRKLLCITAAQFYSQLQEESQKTAFISTFQSAETIHPDSPFSEILKTVL